ncbi:MAG: hypothetical protein A2569_01880 [Candidatus Vogelbacteria bacterium RIFOXYD1_FULL_51_18]|uniref:Ribonuclease J n=1 Tax=Candidatus Vogelbacteria bacterium RIFOXYD1_FULL_51_18 TaxID=1802440 RepID=A0A1G2QJD4_9BACT|nr:MAG: putative hydrolase of the metallo-beta-lactamase superfamily [Parcubacteria group bacterium GW2011_GWC1_51_35]OHA60557.1 MAG: hypothetical protein A2569_01880 [Candidatus Vogelbacteria bacterium RIFOXYD1_FULL_51_18]
MPIPKLEPGDIRIIPLGGVEEVGKNMTAIEYGGEIVVVDIGVQFPDEQTPGVDYIIPDTSYLEERASAVKAVLVTHGHLDHIGGIPFVMGKIGNPPIYTTLLTAVMIKKRQEEFPHLAKLNIEVIARGETLRVGKHFSFRFFETTHTIPDTVGIIMDTPYGNIVMTGDIKIDHKNGVPEPHEVETFSAIGKEKNLLLIADSTNVEKPGFSYSERDVHINLHKIISEATGRLIVGTFASLLERIIFIIKDAEEMGKKIVIEGRSMKTNVEIARELGLLSVHRGTIIPAEEMQNYPDNKIVVLATGAQGDEYAALMRISNRAHKTVKLKKGDVTLLSSSVIPGNEKAVQKLKDNLARQGAKIIHNNIADVHSSGHSYGGELQWVHEMVKARFFMPVHGYHHMLRVHADMAERLGTPEKNIIVPDNGSVIEIVEEGKRIIKRKENASAGIVMVDSLGTGDVKDVVIRDRQMLSEEGIFMIVAIINLKTGKVRKSPDIISRGFVYLKESQDLLHRVRFLIKKTIETATSKQHPINFDYVRNEVRETVGKLLFQETHKRPIILPVLIEV